MHQPKVDEKTPGSLSSREESAGTPTCEKKREKQRRSAVQTVKPQDSDTVHRVLMSTLSLFYIYNYFSFSLLVMNSEAAQKYNSFSLLANLEKNKVICKALFTLVRHSSPLPTWALSLSLLRSRKPPPPQPIRLQISTRCFFSIKFFIFKIYVCVFIYLIEKPCFMTLFCFLLLSLLFRGCGVLLFLFTHYFLPTTFILSEKLIHT